MATRFLLFIFLPKSGTLGRLGWESGGCGAWIRTKDLRVMSPTSCRCSTPRFQYKTSTSLSPQGRRAKDEGRCSARPRRRRGARSRDQKRPLVRLGEAAHAGLLFVGRAVGKCLHVLAVAGVLGRDLGVLRAQLGDLLAEALADVGLLRKRDRRPHQHDACGNENQGAPQSERAHAKRARGGGGGV